MADLSDLNAAQTIKIAGAGSSGSETTYVDATSAGGIHANLRNNAGTEIGTSGAPVRVDPTGTTTQPVSDAGGSLTIDAVSLPLPTGAATAANQTAEIALLTTIDAGLPVALGQTTMANSMPVTIASDQSTITVSAIGAEGTKATYSAAIISSTLPALATDFFTITGSATKTIRVLTTSVAFVGGGVVVSTQLVKRSTANTGGTSSTLAAVPHDSNNAAGTATVRSYTINPTVLGTLVGAIRADKTSSPLVSSTTTPEGIEYYFGNRPGQTIVLRGTSQVLAWNFNGVTLSGGTFVGYIEWTEE